MNGSSEVPNGFRECFVFDASELNPLPRGWGRTLMMLIFSARYSMPVLLRLTQYFYRRGIRVGGWRDKFWGFLSLISRRLNEVVNHFEHESDPCVAAGVVFHHTGVCMTGGTVLEAGVHVYRNVTFGMRNGGSPRIQRGARIGSHSVVLGAITVGVGAIVAPGAVVIRSIPDGKIAAGIPAEVIGDVNQNNSQF